MLWILAMKELRDGFPKAAKDLYPYHAILLDDVDASFFTQDQMELIRKFVAERGGGLLMLGGSDSLERERVLEAGFSEVFLVPHADDAGQAFAQKLDRALHRAGFSGRLLVVNLPADDVSDLHVECGSTFSAAFDVAVERAQTIADFAAGREQVRVTAKTALATIVENVLLTKHNTNTTDKVILIAAARATGNEPAGRIPMSNSRLAKTAGIPRRTFQSRLRQRRLH